MEERDYQAEHTPFSSKEMVNFWLQHGHLG
jgi:hypothetical protein